MSELYYGVLENLPYVAVPVGMVAGAMVDARAAAKVAEQRQPIVEEYPGLLPEDEISKSVQFKQRIVGGIAITGAFIGLANGLAWQHNAPPEAKQPSVELVVDYSGATGVNQDGQAPVETTNQVVSLFAERDGDDFDVQAFVARSGGVAVREPNEVAEFTPFGEAPLEQALTSALDQIALRNQEAPTEQEESGSAIVVVSHGNVVGASAAIAERTQTSTPVFIVNVEEGISEASQASLEAVAEATGGEFWNADDENIVDEISSVIKDMEPPKQEMDPAHGWGERILAGVLSAAGMAAAIKRRKDEPLTFNGLSVPKGTKGE